ncbi:hypothetical protein AAK913_12035 [Enterococcus faecium]|uniref:hypothetical protein n=2 Tax=Enterococcus faecium TaxID=1352 RepID=UPI0035170FA4|nr:hypothetical protein [Enterococcus faecium]
MSQRRLNILLNIFLVFSIFSASTVSFLWYQMNKQKDNVSILENKVSHLQNSIRDVELSKSEYTTKTVNDTIVKNSVDMSQAFSETRKKIKEGITIVYNETKNENDYSNLEKRITPLLGTSFTKKLVSLDEPIVNQSGSKSFPFEKLVDVKVAFGEYDFVNNYAKCFVVVKYESPRIKTTKTGVAVESDTYSFIKGQDFFNLNYNVDSGNLELINYQKGTEEEVIDNG